MFWGESAYFFKKACKKNKFMVYNNYIILFKLLLVFKFPRFLVELWFFYVKKRGIYGSLCNSIYRLYKRPFAS